MIHPVYPKSVVHGKPNLSQLPTDWFRTSIGNIVKPIQRPANIQDKDTYELITVKRSRGGVISRGKLLGRAIKTKTQFIVKANDFLISNRQIVHGACGVVPEELDGAIASNEYTVLHAKGNLTQDFLKYLSYSIHFQKTCFHASVGVHVEKMVFNLNRWLDFKIDIPPREEQLWISNFFNLLNQAINLTEKLIVEKQQLRKGLMQQLLTGKHRLPGFDGEWREVQLGEIFHNRKETGRIDLPLVAITSERGVIPRDEIDRKDSSSKDKSKYLRICPGDIGYNTMRMWQGVSGLSSIEGIVSPAYTIVTPREGICGEFMAILFKSAPVIHLFCRYSQGMVSDTWNLKFHHFTEIKVTIPNEDEQVAISNIFKTVDRELELLQAKAEALREQKKGLMQQLLTGKVRVKM